MQGNKDMDETQSKNEKAADVYFITDSNIMGQEKIKILNSSLVREKDAGRQL
jgi:hypothetical protein